MLGSSPREIALSYRSLATMNDAGQPVVAALENLHVSLGHSEREILRRMLARVRRGSFVSAAMAAEGLSPLDVALMKVGEQSGTLTEIERYLMSFYEERYELERAIRRALQKPVGLFVMSLFLRDLPGVFAKDGSVSRYLLHTVPVLAVVAATGLFLFRLYRRSYRSRHIAEMWSRFFLKVPWFGGVVRTLAYERFFTTLSIGLKSGLDLAPMMELGASMTTLPALKLGTARILSLTQKAGLAKAFADSRLFRPDQLLILSTGEQAGQLDEAFAKIRNDLREELQTKLKTFEEWLPRIVYALAMIYVIYGVVSSYQKIWQGQERLLHLDD